MKFLPFQKNSWKHTPSFESWHICAVETAYSFRVTYKTSFPWYKSQHLQLSKCSKHGMKFEEWYIINLITWSSLESVSALLIIHTLCLKVMTSSIDSFSHLSKFQFHAIFGSTGVRTWKNGGSNPLPAIGVGGLIGSLNYYVFLIDNFHNRGSRHDNLQDIMVNTNNLTQRWNWWWISEVNY